MARKKSLLGMDRMDPDFGFGSTEIDLAANGDLSIRNNSRQLHRVSATHEAAMRLVAKKILLAMQTEADLHKFASLKYLDSLKTSSYDLEQAKGKEYQPYLEEFARHLRAVTGQQLIGSVKLGGEVVVRQAMIPPFPDPEPEPEEDIELTWLGRRLFKNR